MNSWIFIIGACALIAAFLTWAKRRRPHEDSGPIAEAEPSRFTRNDASDDDQRRSVEMVDPAHPELDGGEFPMGVRGVTRRARSGRQRQAIISTTHVGERVKLQLEPKNPRDENAVLVLNLAGEDLGYIPAEHARRIADDMRDGKVYEVWVWKGWCSRTGAGPEVRGVVLRLQRP